jgi:protocatechuate 3,4-dioxygenase beta subunit
MSTRSSLLAVLLLALFAAAIWWLSDGSRPEVGSTPANAAAAPAGDHPVEAKSGQQGKPAAGEANLRQAVEPEAAPVAVGSGGAVLGRVVDDDGRPLPGAKVSCTPSLGPDPANFDAASFDWQDLEPARLVDRAREQTKQKVEAVTDAQGAFRLVPLGKGARLDLRVRARAHVLLDHNVERPGSTDVDLGTLTLKSGGIVSGRVVERSGQPIQGALVMRGVGGAAAMTWVDDIEMPGMEMAGSFPGTGDTALTDVDGRFELPHLAAGELSLRARHPDHPVAKLDGLTLLAGQTLADLVITADAAAAIRGRVLGVPEQVKSLRVLAAQKRAADPATQNPFAAMLGGDPADMLADAGMEFGERSGAVGADGTFALRGLHDGRTYRIWAVQSGKGFAGNTACSQRLEVAAGTDGVELRYETGIAVTFRVVNDKTSGPVERMWVDDQLKGGGVMDFMGAFAGAGSKNRHYPDGVVTIANLRPKPKQTLSLRIEALGFARLEREGVALPAQGQIDLGTLRLSPQPVVRVNVVSAGSPVAGAKVSLRGNGDQRRMPDFMAQFGGGGPRSGTTGSDGSCTLNGMPGAEVVLSVDSKLHAPWSGPAFKLPEQEDWRQRVELVRGGSVQVTVAGADGKPATGIQVEHTAPGDHHDRRATDGEGRAVFERLAPGTHAFRPGSRSAGPDIMAAWRDMAGGSRDETGWQNVEVTDGSVAALELRPKPASSLTGLVRENGAPLAGARIAFQEGAGENADPANELVAAMGDLGGMGGMGAGGRNVRTDADGRYRLKDLPPGEHRLQVSHKDRAMPATVRITLREGDNTFDVDLDISVVRGIVRDADGAPVAGATVEAMAVHTGDKGQDQSYRAAMQGAMGMLGANNGNRLRARTDDQGHFELRGVQGPMQVRAQAKGFAATTSAPVEARGGQDLVLVLHAAGAVRVQAPNAPAFAAVEAVWAGDAADGVDPVFALLRNGNATLSGLRPGTWTIQLNTADDHGSQKKTVEVTAGNTLDLGF